MQVRRKPQPEENISREPVESLMWKRRAHYWRAGERAAWSKSGGESWLSCAGIWGLGGVWKAELGRMKGRPERDSRGHLEVQLGDSQVLTVTIEKQKTTQRQDFQAKWRETLKICETGVGVELVLIILALRLREHDSASNTTPEVGRG